MAFACGRWGWSRRNATLLVSASIMLAGIPVTLSFGPLADYTWAGRSLFDWLDFLTSNLMMPLFAIVICLLFGWSSRLEGLLPSTLSPLWRRALRFTWRYAAPLCIGVILLHGVW